MTQIQWPESSPSEQPPTPRERSGDGSILINFVLDKSGSMQAVRQATIDGFNEFLGDQGNQPGEAFLTLTMFDTSFYGVCTAVPLREMPAMGLAEYQPGGMTALYDAIGHAVGLCDDWLAQADALPDQVLFVIMTDGQENSSQEFSRKKIFDLIREREQAGYEFVYLGANQDAYAEADMVGVAASSTRHWLHNDAGARAAHARLNQQISTYRSAGVAHMADADLSWFERDEHLGDEAAGRAADDAAKDDSAGTDAGPDDDAPEGERDTA